MIRHLAFPLLLILATAAPAQPPRLTERQRQHSRRWARRWRNAMAGRCCDYARTPMSVAQIVERALAACAGARGADPRRGRPDSRPGERGAALAAQRQHYRQGIAQMVAQARAAR